MKNVLVINQFASVPELKMGAGERIYRMGSFLYSKGYKLTVLSAGYSHLFKVFPPNEKLFNNEKHNEIDYVWVRLRKYKASSYLGRVLSWFEFLIKLFFYKNKTKPDIVLVSSMSLLPIIYALWIKFRYRAKFILEIRDIWPETPIQMGGFSRYNPLLLFLRLIEIKGYKSADFIISVLPGFNKYLQKHGIHRKPFMWIPNGISEDISDDMGNNPLNFDLSKFNILYTGTIGEANVLEYLVDAASLLKTEKLIKIHIIGNGPQLETLKERASKLENVIFHMPVAKSQIQAILRSGDLCYIGWRNLNLYGYGVSANKYNDYMLSGKPILSSSSINDDPVKIGQCGIQVRPESAKEIADGIIKFLNMSSEDRELYGRNGLNYVTKNQTYTSIAKKYAEVFEIVLGL